MYMSKAAAGWTNGATGWWTTSVVELTGQEGLETESENWTRLGS